MPVQCVAYGCGKTCADGVSLHTFPKDPEDFRRWEKQVQRTRSGWTARTNSHLCSDHFAKESFRQKARGATLRPGSMPTVFIRPPCPSCEGRGCTSCLQLLSVSFNFHVELRDAVMSHFLVGGGFRFEIVSSSTCCSVWTRRAV